MAKLKLKERQVTTEEQRRRIASRSDLEQLAFDLGLGGAAAGFAGAPTIADILRSLAGPTAADIDLARRATFGGITEGLAPQLQEALRIAREQAGGRNIPQSSIAAALQARAVPQVMATALAQAQRGFAGLLTELPFRRAGALAGVRGQEFTGLQQALAGGLSERAQAVDTSGRAVTERFAPSSNFFKRLLGSGLGALGGAFLSPITGLAGAAGQNLFGGLFDGGDSTAPLGGTGEFMTGMNLKPM